jgi:hypothetical protein
MAPLPPPSSGAIAHDNTPGGSESPGCCVWGISGQVAAGYGVRAASTVEPGPQVFVFDEPVAWARLWYRATCGGLGILGN